jgi:hypothetical protein
MIYSALKEIYFRISHILREGYAYYHELTKELSREQERIVIYGQGRTGSTLLESLLASTGYFAKHGELLAPKFRVIKYPMKFIRGLAKSKNTRGFIFHLKSYHLTKKRKKTIEPSHFLEELQKDGWFIIYLRRENKVKHALSSIIAHQRGSFHKVDDKIEELNVHVDCENLRRRINKRIKIDRIDVESLKNISFHEVVYDLDLEHEHNHQSTIDNILKKIHLEPKMASSKQRKIYRAPLHEIIKNYDEFIDCVQNNGWKKYLS